MHVPALVSTIAIALGAALIFGALAMRLRLSPIVGYLVAGIAVGPHTPGLVADSGLATQLAEIGIALLMFGVGLHFSPRELAAVRRVAVPGALAQSLVATLAGAGIGLAWGWGLGAGIVLGLAVSVASTVVLIRALEDHDLLASSAGRTAIGWLIVEDLLTVVILVVLPAAAGILGGTAAAEGGHSVGFVLGATLLKVGLLVAVVLVAGRRVVPWLLDRVASLGSRELFTLGVLGIALGIAVGSAWAAGVSMALGAFLAGMAVGQSDLSHRAAADSIPLRDAFAVLFFVSVGMLFDPKLVVEAPGLLLATLGVILVVKPLVAIVLVLAFGRPLRTALTIGIALAQVGEFSFILTQVGSELGLLPQAGHDAVLAGALVSITLNPMLFRLIGPLDRFVQSHPRLQSIMGGRKRRAARLEESIARHGLRDHVVLCGSGRVGTVVGRVLAQRGWRSVVIESDRARTRKLRERGAHVLDGDAASPIVLDHAHVRDAALLVVTFDDPVTTRLVLQHALQVNPSLPAIVRVGSRGERDRVEAIPGVQAVMGEFEAAAEMSRRALRARGVSMIETEAVILDLRRLDQRDPAAELTASLVPLEVPEGTAIHGRTLASLRLPASVRVVTVQRAGAEIIARGDTTIEAGDLLLVLADADGLGELRAVIERPAARP